MLERLIDLDKDLLLAINSWHTPWLDQLMMAMTNGLNWLPLFLLVISMIIYKYRWHAVTIIGYIILVIILTDQISASLLKPLVARLRPSHDPGIKDLVHLVNNYRGGLYSFVSSHAANAFGVATFLFLRVRSQLNWIWVMFLWAAIFSYTRLYLGVHFPLDIICGGILGAILAYLVFLLGKIVRPGRQDD
jgi:undecaprenyl-diphosphatase